MRKSFSTELKDPSPFRSREITIDEMNQFPLYSNWFHQISAAPLPPAPLFTISQFSERRTSTSACVLAFCRPYEGVKRDSKAPSFHFWRKPSTIDEDLTIELKKVIKSQYSRFFSRIRFDILIDPSASSFHQSLASNRMRSNSQRIVIHYVGHNLPPYESGQLFFPTESHRSPNEYYDMKTLLQSVGNWATLIFDRDFAGALKPQVTSFLDSSANHGESPPDIVAFFSCGPNEMMPRSSDFPTDIFTACLTTPARIALVWHSRHYFCFNSGPLQPLSPFFVEEGPQTKSELEKIESIFSHLKGVLKSTVESIAYKSLERPLFQRLFRRDPMLADYCINYVLAMRILPYFDITPSSTPSIPDMNDSSEWRVFDLRLDYALYILQSDCQCDSTFLSQTLLSFRGKLSDQCPPEIGYFPLILANPALMPEACNVLSEFLDRSPYTIEPIIHFLVASKLVDELKQRVFLPSIFFCLIKIFSSFPEAPFLLFGQSSEFLDSYLSQIINGKDRVLIRLSLIFISLLIRPTPSRLIVHLGETAHTIVATLKSREGDLLIWSLMALGEINQNFLDFPTKKAILDTIEALPDHNSEEYHCAVVNSLSSFVSFNEDSVQMVRDGTLAEMKSAKKLQKAATRIALRYKKSSSRAVLKEIGQLLANFSSLRKKKVTESKKPFYCEIRDFLASHIQQKTGLVDLYANSFNSRILPILKADEIDKSLSNFEKDVIRSSRPPKRDQFRALKIGGIFRHTSTLTSNLSPMGEDVVFGDKNGEVFSINWNMEVRKGIKLFDEPITCVKYSSNFGSPVILASSSSGAFACADVDGWKLTEKFDLSQEKDEQRIEYDQWSSVLFSFPFRKSDFVNVRDLRSDRILSPIQTAGGRISSVKCLEKYSDYLCVAADGFHLFDLRSGRIPVISAEFDSPLFDIGIVDQQIPIFSICTVDSNVCFMDSRFPQGRRTMTVWLISEGCPPDTLAFSAHSCIPAAAVGHRAGISYVNLINNQQEALPLLPSSYSYTKNANASSILFHESRFELLFVNNGESIVSAVKV